MAAILEPADYDEAMKAIKAKYDVEDWVEVKDPETYNRWRPLNHLAEPCLLAMLRFLLTLREPFQRAAGQPTT